VKIWLALILLAPVAVWGQDAGLDETRAPLSAADAPAADGAPPPNWVDKSHTVATDSAQSLVQWMDDFFGDPVYDAEKAESFLRLEFENDWLQDEGSDFGVRLRGKVQLPKISQRVELLFGDDDTGAGDREELEDSDRVSLQVNVSETRRSRFDATLGWSSSAPKPGVRYRFEDALREDSSYRYVQRLQWTDSDGFFTLAQLDLFQALDSDDMLRWSNRIKWGEETDGVEWRTRLSLFQRWYEDTERPLAVNYYGLIRGETQPESYIKNYALGTILRRRIYRDFLFFEVEPSANYRKRNYDQDRQFAWQLVLRLEIHLARDLVKR